jgi:hypothetical protein
MVIMLYSSFVFVLPQPPETGGSGFVIRSLFLQKENGGNPGGKRHINPSADFSSVIPVPPL